MAKALILQLATALALLCGMAAGRRLMMTPTVLQRPSDKVTVTWCGPAMSTSTIVVYAVAPDYFRIKMGWLPLSRLHPTDSPAFSTLSRSSLGTQSALGSTDGDCVNIELALPYMRDHGYQVDLTEGERTYAVSNIVRFASHNLPWQIHLSLTGKPSEMRVMWTARDELQDAMVCWGEDPSASKECAAAPNPSTYSQADMCGSPANDELTWIPPGMFYDAVMTGLEPSRRYYYRVGSPTAGMSEVQDFIAAPRPKANEATEMVVYGDMGTMLPLLTEEVQQPPAVEVAAHITADVLALNKRGTPTAIMHIGDISYARGSMKLWDSFMQLIQPYASRAPYMISVGNHEYDDPRQSWAPQWAGFASDSGGECGVPTFQRFHMVDSPVDGNVSLSGRVRERSIAYSFDYGHLHFAVMSMEHDYLPGSQQYAFLEQDLASVDRKSTPWVIVAGHRPMYSTSESYSMGADRLRDGPDDHIRSALEPLLRKHKVDLGLWGHVHVYERTCGITGNFTCAARDEDGVVHVTTGAAGNVYQPLWAVYLPESPKYESSVRHSQPEWSIFRTMNFGYNRLRANATHLEMRYYGHHRGTLHDEFVLKK